MWRWWSLGLGGLRAFFRVHGFRGFGVEGRYQRMLPNLGFA